MKIIGLMAIIGIIGFVYSFVMLVKNGASVYNLVDESFNIVVIIVPAALPTCLSIGVAFALVRLNKK